MRMKKLFMLCLCLMFMISAIPVYASSDFKVVEENANIIQPRFTNIAARKGRINGKEVKI